MQSNPPAPFLRLSLSLPHTAPKPATLHLWAQSSREPPAHTSCHQLPSTRSQQLNGSGQWRAQLQAQAKVRYQRMLELQQRSFIERQELDREREELMRAEQLKVEVRAKEMRIQVDRLGQSTRQWHHKNRCEGAELRMQRLYNQTYCLQRDRADLTRKRREANHRRPNLRLSHFQQNKPVEELPLFI